MTDDTQYGPQPLVSVILPTYNRANTLARAIESVLSQSYTHLELIVVDDASTDNTLDLVEQIGDSRLKTVCHSANRGPSAARNSGIKVSQGEYIAFQDSDDVWLTDKLRRQVACLKQAPPQVGAVYSSFWLMDGSQQRLFPSRLTYWRSRLPFKHRNLGGDIYQSLMQGNFITPQATIIRRTCFTTVGLFDEELTCFEDWELWLRMAQHYQFLYMAEPLVMVYVMLQSASANQRAWLKGLKYIVDKYTAAGGANPLKAHYLFASGDRLYRGDEPEEGRKNLFQAIRLAPFNTSYWVAAGLALLGQKIYRRVTTRWGIGYGRG